MEPVETFVFLPYNRYKALDSRAKKEQTELPVSNSGGGLSSEEISSEPIPSQSDELIEVKKPIGKDLTKSYRGVQMKKLLQHIEKTEGSSEIVNLPNLEELIKNALSNSKKRLPNEELFFTFIFDHGMSRFVKNHSKIDLYYKYGPWYSV